MRKAYTVSAIALAASLAIAAPAAAFAADGSPSASPTSSASATPSKDQGKQDQKKDASDKAEAKVAITSSPKDKAGYKAGEKVTFTVTTSGEAKVSASSDALKDVSVSGSGTSYTGSGVVKDGFGIGTAKLLVTVNYPDTGAQSTATFSVNTDGKPKPDPSKASMSLSTDGGKVGDKVGITIKSGDLKGNAYVESDAFGGKVNLVQDKTAAGTWHGTATVASNVKDGYYSVKGYVGSTLVDTAKFGTQGSDKPAFIAVGLLHFLGEKRLPKLLLQRGCTVQKFIDGKGCRRAAGMSWAPSRLRNDTSLQACVRPARAS